MGHRIRTDIVSGDSQSSPSHSAQHNYLALALLARGHSVVDYNATGDGTTDDTTAVQAAIDACNAAGGGVVFFPEGTYICSTLTWYSNIYGVGVGMQSSILKLKAGTDDDLIKGYNFASLTGGDTVDGIHDFGFRDLKLDGNKDNNASTSWCLRFYGYRPFLQDVWVANGNDGGIYSQGFTSTDPINGANRYGRFSNVEVSSCGGDGVYINGIGDSIFSECVIHNNSGDGIHVGPIGFGVKLYGCHIYGNPQDHCVHSEAAGMLMVGNIFEGADDSLVWLDAGADNNQIKGNYFYAAGTQTTKIGVEIDEAETFSIVGNHFVGQTDGSVYSTDDDGSGYISGNYVFQASGTAFGGTFAGSTLINNNQVVGGANGGPGSTITIASGVATMYPGAPMIFLAGEGAAADVLDTLTPIARLGERVYIVANHEITFNHAAGGTGQVLCPGGVDYVLAQYGAVCLVSSDPNWILVEG